MTVMIVLVALLVIWLALIVIGLAIKAVLWLAIVGLALFLATAGIGAVHHLTKPGP